MPENDFSYSYSYKLIVSGYIGQTLVFSNSTTLQYSPKSLSILLQTDKPKYKPGQGVKIRALVLSPDGKPCNKKINVAVMVSKSDSGAVNVWCNVSEYINSIKK